jgi:hypothetical protein
VAAQVLWGQLIVVMQLVPSPTARPPCRLGALRAISVLCVCVMHNASAAGGQLAAWVNSIVPTRLGNLEAKAAAAAVTPSHNLR